MTNVELTIPFIIALIGTSIYLIVEIPPLVKRIIEALKEK